MLVSERRYYVITTLIIALLLTFAYLLPPDPPNLTERLDGMANGFSKGPEKLKKFSTQ